MASRADRARPSRARLPTIPSYFRYRGVHAGSRFLLARTLKLERLPLHVFGHIHEDATAFWRGRTIVANVTHVDGEYTPRYPVRVFEL